MRGLLLALCLVLAPFAGANPATAEPGLQCEEYAPTELRIRSISEQLGAIVMPLNHDEAQRFLAVVNASPPETHFEGEDALVVVNQDMSSALFLRQGPNLCGFVKLIPALTNEALLAARGRPA